MQNFAGKEYDTVTLVPSYLVASLITGAMDTDDRYPVSPDTNIALLQNTKKNEVVQLFHALDVNKVIESMESQGYLVDKGNSPNGATRGMTSFIGHNIISFFSGNYKVSFPVISFLEKETGIIRRITDIENVTLKTFLKDEDEWEEISYGQHYGFKKIDPTGFFIEELGYTLDSYSKL
jgi:hypothetical protein